MLSEKKIVDTTLFDILIQRLCHQLLENHTDFTNSCIVGLQPRGILLAERLHSQLTALTQKEIQFGKLDVSFHRDDFGRNDKLINPSNTDVPFLVENKNVILVDDVLYTGRTIRAGLDAILDFGRPKKIELVVLIDRRFSRDVPIQPDYIGKTVDSVSSEKVKVQWKHLDGEDCVILYTSKNR
ncbi:MAG: bifunctional pyr operon transcriptional regulator/uracil phosphoribosyltransferase PyrR [Flavobacteriales bacterium]|nr:bifunctional pyr operon transcriptional regulator/uracil phosphoribosyltransferase PyrR [Flavobacteriales bacterium]